jgi:hypothetical protein
VTRRRRKNPVDAITYWVVLGGLVTTAVAIAAWKAMSARDRASVLPVSGGKPNDVAIGGPWTMLDVDARGKAKDPLPDRQAVKRGAIVAVLLNAGDVRFNMPYVVSVLGSSGRPELPFTGTWAIAAPPAGPQAIDFGPEHIFTIA